MAKRLIKRHQAVVALDAQAVWRVGDKGATFGSQAVRAATRRKPRLCRERVVLALDSVLHASTFGVGAGRLDAALVAIASNDRRDWITGGAFAENFLPRVLVEASGLLQGRWPESARRQPHR